MKFKKGDKVKIVGNCNYILKEGYNGLYGTIVGLGGTEFPYTVRFSKNNKTSEPHDSFNRLELKLVNEFEVVLYF